MLGKKLDSLPLPLLRKNICRPQLGFSAGKADQTFPADCRSNLVFVIKISSAYAYISYHQDQKWHDSHYQSAFRHAIWQPVKLIPPSHKKVLSQKSVRTFSFLWIRLPWPADALLFSITFAASIFAFPYYSLHSYALCPCYPAAGHFSTGRDRSNDPCRHHCS